MALNLMKLFAFVTFLLIVELTRHSSRESCKVLLKL